MAIVLYQGPPENAFPGLTSASSTESFSEKYVGLSNQGATCYLNGLLQTLFMTPEFRKAIFTWNYDVSKHGAEEWCIPLQLQRLFGLLQLSKQKSVDTVALTHSFGWEGSEVFQQQDVQELTRVLFDALEETFKGTEVENIIDELYAGELIDYLRCIDVDYQSERVDKFLDFSLAIVPFGSDQPMHSLTECIEMYLRPEILDGDNKYYAEQFNIKTDAIKGLKFGKLPQIMSVQLKRFVYDFSGPSIVQKKLNDVVKFPMILDMNRYVGKRANTTDSCTSDVESEEQEETNEFERFLLTQIEQLKAVRESSPKQQEIVAEAMADMNIGKGQEHGTTTTAHVAEEREHKSSLPPLISELPDYEDPFGAVGLEGEYFSEHIGTTTEATASEAPCGAEKEADAGVVYESLTRAEVLELIARRGEWVYELFAVLIHSGVINGGHYYAYIKDLSTQRWFNFNDSTVTAIDEKTVQEAWGRQLSYTCSYSSAMPSYYGSSLYNRASTNNLSTANAYMLMYRKVAPLQGRPSSADSSDATSSGITESSVVTDAMVPQYIRELVETEARQEEERRRALEELRNRLSIKVYFNGTEHVIKCTRSNTFDEFLTLAWQQLDVKTHLGEILTRHLQNQADGEAKTCCTDVPSDQISASLQSLNSPCFDLFRLRNYNSFTHLKTEAYDHDTSGALSLDALNFRDHRTFLLETRSGEQNWEVYYVDGISMLILEYDPDTHAFKEPRNLRVQRTATLSDVRQAVAKWVVYPLERIRLMKLVNCGYNDAQKDILTDDSARLREDLNIYEGYKLYVEDAALGEESRAYEAFLDARNCLEVRVNKPPEGEFSQALKVDLRWDMPRLRSEIARSLGLEGEELRVFKQSLRGQELRDGTSTLAASGIYNNICLAVSIGKVTPVGFYNIILLEYVAPDVRAGVVYLPDLEPEVEEVVGDVAAPALLSDISAEGLTEDDHAHVTVKTGVDDKEFPVQSLYPDDEFYADYNAELDAALERGSDVGSNQGVADADELQQMDDDLDAFTDCNDSVGGSEGVAAAAMVAVDAVSVADADNAVGTAIALSSADASFDKCAAEVAMNFSNSSQETMKSAVTAVPLLDVLLDSSNEPSPAPVHSPTDFPAQESIVPSDFGEKLVANMLSPQNFKSVEGLTSMLAQSSTTLAEFKAQIANKLIALGRLPEGASSLRIRLREKMGNNPGKILCGTGGFSDVQVYLYDSKLLAFQVLEEEEVLAEPELGSAVVMVQRFNRSEWKLEDRFEVLLRGDMSVRNIARGLSALTGIPLQTMQAMVVVKDSEFFLSDLHLKSPPRSYGRSWFDPTKETRLLRVMSHEMRLTDGDVLLLQDTAEPLRELSPADRRSVEIVRVASEGTSYTDIWDESYSTSHNPFETNYTTSGISATSSAKSLRLGHNGVYIKTQRDRQQEASDRSLSSVAAVGDSGNSSTIATPSGAVTPVPPLDSAEAEYSENNIDTREFQRQGGFALFEDIN